LSWVVSLLFWGQLLLAAALYASVALSPKLMSYVGLRTEYTRSQSQLVLLEQQVNELQQVTEALQNDPRVLRELARIDLDAVRPGEERIPLQNELMLQSRVVPRRIHEPEVTRTWYQPALEAFATNSRLRTGFLLAAASLILISFTFFHPSQAAVFSSGWKSMSRTAGTVGTRYRRLSRAG